MKYQRYYEEYNWERKENGSLVPVCHKHDLKSVDGMIAYLKGTLVTDLMKLSAYNKGRAEKDKLELFEINTSRVKKIVYKHYKSNSNFNVWLKSFAEELVNDGWLPLKK